MSRTDQLRQEEATVKLVPITNVSPRKRNSEAQLWMITDGDL